MGFNGVLITELGTPSVRVKPVGLELSIVGVAATLFCAVAVLSVTPQSSFLLVGVLSRVEFAPMLSAKPDTPKLCARERKD